MKAYCRGIILPALAVTAAVMMTGCPLPFDYKAPGAANSQASDPSTPSVTAPVLVSYSVQGGSSGTVGDGGSFYSGQTTTVTLSTATAGAVIFYTDNGTPLALSGLSSAKKVNGSSGEMTISRAASSQSLDIHAIAIGPNMLPSSCVHATVGVSPYPIISITRDKTTASEDGGTASFIITSSSPAPAGGITISLASTIDATGRCVTTGNLPFPASFTEVLSQSTTTLSLPVIGQPDIDTQDGTVTLTILTDPNPTTTYTVGAPSSAGIVIQDNHMPTYTVTYSGNGNTSGAAPTDSNSYHAGDTVTVANMGSLVKTAFAFSGWNTALDGTGTAYGAGTTMPMGTANMVLYAVWAPTYTVTYNGNLNTGGTAPIDGNSYLPGVPVTVANGGSLTKIGFAFAGWNTASNGSGTGYNAGASMPMAAANVTLYAVWTPTYSVTYNGNGNTSGSVPSDGTSYLPGASVTVKPQGTMLRSGFTFTGWNTQANGSGTTYAAGSLMTMGAGNVTLFAVWTTWRIIYVGNGNDGGTVPNDINGYAAGVQVTVLGPGSMSLSNGFFAGWNTAADGKGTTTYAGGDTLILGTANVTLYAMWVTFSGTTLTSVPQNVTSLVIPEGVTILAVPPSYPLSNHPYLASVTIPSTVTTIPDETLLADPQLTTIISNNARFQVINGALVDTQASRLIVLPARTSGAYIIPSVTSIGQYAFDYCANLTSITIPASLTTIGNNAFSGFTSRIPIVIPDTVTTIGGYAFVYSDFTKITVSANVTFIGQGAMYGCSYLTNVTMLGSNPPTLQTADVFASSPLTVHVADAATKAAYLAFSNWLATGVSITYP